MNVTPLLSISRIDELALREVMKRDAAAYLPTLASDRNYPDAVRELDALLPPHASNLHGILWHGDAVTMGPRIAEAFGLFKHKANGTTPLSKVFKTIRETQGPVGEAVRTLLTGSGDCPAALLLRRVVEHRRGEPLPGVDISQTGEPSPEFRAIMEAEKAHVEAERGATDTTELQAARQRAQARRNAAKAARKAKAAKKAAAERKRAEQRAKQSAAIAARSAKQLERDRIREEKTKRRKRERADALERWTEAHDRADAQFRERQQ